MAASMGDAETGVAWFVGSSFGHIDDQTERFLRDGVWEIHQPRERDAALVRSMHRGERIAIKAAYVRKLGLPFENHGRPVAVMGIKAVGVITANPGDGERVDVQWRTPGEAREWYFNTYQRTIWRVVPGEWMADALIAFAFEGQPQDVSRFLREPYWQERYALTAPDAQRFQWTDFYEAAAEKLLAFKHDRGPLVEALHGIAGRVAGLGYLQDRFPDGTQGPLRDICPFTALGTFNRTMTDANRRDIASAVGEFLGVAVPAPTSFAGVPVLNNQRSWFFRYAEKRGEHDIDALWEVFDFAAKLVASAEPGAADAFIGSYDRATRVWGVSWNLSIGLYWAHPWDFPTLSSRSRAYLSTQLRIDVSGAGQARPCDGRGYLKLVEDLRTRFAEDDYPVHSFPELSLAARQFKAPMDEPAAPPAAAMVHSEDDDSGQRDRIEDDARADEDDDADAAPIVPYSVANVLDEGCFLPRAEIERLLGRLRAKKNLILQGPPGTGKTWLARRLAFALMGQRDPGKVRAVQFHPNLSYEDFVRGWRPTANGTLKLVDGIFMEAIRAAVAEPAAIFVVVIEEINRGNPAQIFGELLTLLEAGKRSPSDAIELCYADADGKRRPVHVPENLYLIGTMNVADRSLALVDMALRRRFAFATLEPRLGPVWQAWVADKCGVDAKLAADIERRLVELNTQIADDPHLGKQYRVGHSYVTPTKRLEPGATRDWFSSVAATEIGPLLDEYWFDNPDVAARALQKLVQGW